MDKHGSGYFDTFCLRDKDCYGGRVGYARYYKLSSACFNGHSSAFFNELSSAFFKRDSVSDAVKYSDSNKDKYSVTCADFYGDAHGYSHFFPHAITHGNRVRERYAFIYTHGDAKRNACIHGHAHTFCDAFKFSDCHRGHHAASGRRAADNGYDSVSQPVYREEGFLYNAEDGRPGFKDQGVCLLGGFQAGACTGIKRGFL